jgi:hypothetical protein
MLGSPSGQSSAGVFQDAANLLPGSLNAFRVCAMAAGNQTSEWSVPMTGICT